MDICRIVSRKGTKASGLKVGETVLVSSTKPMPAKRSDPYLQRIYVVVLLMEKGGKVLIPKDDNEHKAYLMDPRNLEKVSEEDSKKLYELIGKTNEGPD